MARFSIRAAASASAATPEGDSSEQLTPAEAKKEERRKQIKKEGGRFAFNTKYGALNPFAIYYGLTAIALGIPWFLALTICQVLYTVSGNRIDKYRRLPVFFSQIWGTFLMKLTRCTPELINYDVLARFYGRKQAAMFVANHNSWMDIPFVGYTIGWRNYKLISKAELGKVPILGKAIKEGGHVMVDRTNRRSQLKTLKDGIQWIKDGVHLCTFPEGTRTRTGRLLPFKKGAFKMAYKAGAPIVPLSIIGSGKAMPSNWMFPRYPTHGCQVVIHEPIESEGKTEAELAEEVRAAIISGLPEDQRPLPEKPKKKSAPPVPAPVEPSPSSAPQE
jgi:1-acyl-sn-glycerol-3-phosphate acyltransferase